MSERHWLPLLGDNPLFIKSTRSRLRTKELVPWVLVTFVLSAFVFFLAYLMATRRGEFVDVDAAKVSLLGVLVLQSMLLMFFGSGAVATGMALERDAGVLDYQRMTPMKPIEKIIGHLFGLPVREYLLFGVTLPFAVYAIIVGQVDLLGIVRLYVVFFSAVWLLHLIGMVSGMVTPKPRRAGLIAQGMVVLLYLVMPELSRVAGFHFFQYLTVRPTFMVTALEETAHMAAFAQNESSFLEQARQLKEVPFFNLNLDAVVFSLGLQGFVAAAMFIVVYRKWRDERRHPISKNDALLFYGGAMFLTVGCLWPYLSRTEMFETLYDPATDPRAWVMVKLCFVYFAVAGLAALLVLCIVTPSLKSTFRHGIRRARKLGLPRVPLNSDGASSLVLGPWLSAIAIIGFVVLMQGAMRYGRFGAEPPSGESQVLAAILFVAMILVVQSAAELLGMRGFFMFVFVAWVCPVLLAALVVMPFRDMQVTASYIATPCPPAALLWTTTNMGSDQVQAEFGRVGGHVPILAAFAAGLYCVTAGVLLVLLVKREKRIVEAELQAADELGRSSGSGGQPDDLTRTTRRAILTGADTEAVEQAERLDAEAEDAGGASEAGGQREVSPS